MIQKHANGDLTYGGLASDLHMIDRIRKYSRSFHGARRRGFGGWLTPTQHNRDSVEERAVKLRRYLQDNGPVYSSFALYLSSRIDLLPAEHCRELELTPDISPALPPSEVEQIMIEELGAKFPRLFKAFVFLPMRSGLIGQTHRAELVNGEAVTVFVLRPGYSSASKTNQLREWFYHTQMQDLRSYFSKQEVIADFLAVLRRLTDLQIRSQTVALMSSHSNSAGTGPFRRFYGELSGKKVLTLSYAEEVDLEQSLCAGGHDLQTVAREVCQRWLRESLNDRFCPVDPRLRNIITTAPSAIDFGGNEFIELPRHTKDNLRRYLLATLEDDPDLSAHYLLQEMVPPKCGVNKAGEFRSAFRQAAYFGALEPVLGTNTNALAQLIFQHWKTALDYGYKPTIHLLCFYRGLFSIARVAWKIIPTEDPLREGLEELDCIMAADQFKEIASASYWFQTSDKFATAMIRFPRALDEALNQASQPDLDNWSESTAEHSSRNRQSPLARGVLVAAAIIFILQGGGTAWMQKSLILVLMIAGLIALGVWDD